MTESQILSAFSQGDPLVFEMLYKRFHTRVFLIARRYFDSDEDAEDARSNAFIRLWQQRERLKFENMGGVYTWLRTTTAHCCVDVLRRSTMVHKKREKIEEALAFQNQQEEIFEVSDKEAVILERIMKLLDGMEPKFKKVFEMRCYHDLKFVEIAQLMNERVSTVKKRYARAVKLLSMTQRIIIFII